MAQHEQEGGKQEVNMKCSWQQCNSDPHEEAHWVQVAVPDNVIVSEKFIQSTGFIISCCSKEHFYHLKGGMLSKVKNTS